MTTVVVEAGHDPTAAVAAACRERHVAPPTVPLCTLARRPFAV